MPESTNSTPNTICSDDDIQTALALLDDSEFRKGFIDGVGAYANEVEDYERPITTREMCQTIHHDLDPKVRQNGQALCTFYGWSTPSHIYEVGFMAGWVAGHTNTLDLLTT